VFWESNAGALVIKSNVGALVIGLLETLPDFSGVASLVGRLLRFFFGFLVGTPGERVGRCGGLDGVAFGGLCEVTNDIDAARIEIFQNMSIIQLLYSICPFSCNW